jgi:hypothetical protein
MPKISPDFEIASVEVPVQEPLPRKTVDQVLEPVATAKPAVMAAAPMAIAPSSGSDLSVTDVRVGEHPGKTRLVMDLSAFAPKYSADLDNAERVLVIDLPGAAWDAATSRALDNSPVVKAYTAQSTDTGTRVVVELKTNAKLTMNTAMAPNSVHGNRIVLDVSAL